ncbi:MAG TPA: type II secretion system minor pseudopilin GspK [Steroidobacteraceae bacterium]|nr:type II secretion system minor pseudopilin GspK [Steroidobacteraceae bacterium]
MNKHSQRGVAMITAILIVALATILAVHVGYQAFLDQRRSVTAFSVDQGFQVALGAEAWVADILQKDAKQSPKSDDYTEEWAMRIPPLPVDGGEIIGQVDDMQGRFNLNSLIKWDQTKNQYVTDDKAVERLKRLLDILKLEDKWAGVIADWIDADIDAGFPDGAEDPTYTGLQPAYRTANMPITRTSELLALAGFGLERYQKLEPFVTALPMGTPINLCTAPPPVLDALTAKQRQYTMAVQSTAQTRKQRCFPTLQDLQAQLDPNEKTELIDGKVVSQTSSYFRTTVWVTIGTTQLTLYSLLYRQNNLVRPVQRSLGTL